MTDEQTLFTGLYPLFPRGLVEKYTALVPLELAAYFSNVQPEIVSEYDKLKNSIAYTVPASASVTIYRPYAQNQTRTDLRFNPLVYFNVDYFGNPISDQYYYQECNYAIYYDRRIFSGVTGSLAVAFVKTGEFVKSRTRDLYPVNPVYTLTINPQLMPYSGIESVLAMAQNGIDIKQDYQSVKEFATFISAYKKYSGQLSASMSLQAEKSKQDKVQYQNALSDKLAARKNELNDLKTQIAFAAQNETNSAKRDMQNLALNAQSLILQLQEKI